MLRRKINILGLEFSTVNLNDAVKYLSDINNRQRGYICFPSTNTIGKAHKDLEFRSVLNNSLFSFVDGKFTEWYARLKGIKELNHISGQSLLKELMKTDLSHFFYGLSADELKILESKIKINYPNSLVLGYKSPPFAEKESYRLNSNREVIDDLRSIAKLKPDIVWIGISTYKQDFLMANNIELFDNSVLIGVGAVLGYEAETISPGPKFLKQIGMRWLYRLILDPFRLWGSVVPSLCTFCYLAISDVLRGDKNY